VRRKENVVDVVVADWYAVVVVEKDTVAGAEVLGIVGADGDHDGFVCFGGEGKEDAAVGAEWGEDDTAENAGSARLEGGRLEGGMHVGCLLAGSV
jgi:hypothetical protein